ncbi:MAG: hypothetical protein JWN43_155 [Gammaproteobacteria bacterium]|nr:hypothetical protein [Gammaproteobacteria bacterium]
MLLCDIHGAIERLYAVHDRIEINAKIMLGKPVIRGGSGNSDRFPAEISGSAWVELRGIVCLFRDRRCPVGPSTERYQKHRRALFGMLDTENR